MCHSDPAFRTQAFFPGARYISEFSVSIDLGHANICLSEKRENQCVLAILSTKKET